MRAAPALLVLPVLLAALLAAPAPRASSEPPPDPAATARRENVERLGRELRKMATSPRAAEKKPDIRKAIEALSVLGGADAAKEALEALALDDEDVEKDVMTLVETAHHRSLVALVAALVDHRDYRRRFRLHALVAHALAVIADPAGLEPLADLVRSEEAPVVAAAADALATFRAAPHAKRVEPTRRLIDLFETTWNTMLSIRPEDRVARDRARRDWEVYSAPVRKALQALSGQTHLTTPKQFRDWWNDAKKATNW